MSYVSIIDFIEFITGNNSGNVPSSLGSMLDKVRDGVTTGSSGKNNEEFRIMKSAGSLRCVDELRKLEVIKFESCNSIRSFAKKVNVTEGGLVLAVMAAYHQWYLKSPERGLVEVYRLMQKLDKTLEDPVHNEDSLSQSFRMGNSKKAREKAGKLLKDSLLVVDTWIKEWNERVDREIRGTTRKPRHA